ncbi:MAG: DUF2240 family protein [Candidatus Thermoplasmatota archaeon]|nr:DUF2240 family protein [Candidatus Thermoplasmatota archaeon]
MADLEMQIILSFLFKRSGKEELSAAEIYLPLSMDLKWFTPNQAKAFVNIALQQRLLEKKGNKLTPCFDYKKVVVPVGFSPAKQTVLEKEVKLDAMKTIIARISEKTGFNDTEVSERISKISEEKNISDGVAALLVAKEYGVDFEDCFDEIENMVFTENTE